MTHDPLCQYRPEQVCAHCKCVTSYSIRCTCAFIWMVRADERERAAAREDSEQAYQRGRKDAAQGIRELHDWIQSGDTKYCMTCIVDEYSWGAEREPYPCPTIRLLDAAARGDSEQE